jgi:hypothetical protein
VNSASKPQHGNNLELKFLRPVRHPFGQGVQAKEYISDREHSDDQEDRHGDHQDIGLAWCGDEAWQMVRSR